MLDEPHAPTPLVAADERYFLVRAVSDAISRDGQDPTEAAAIAAHRWWTVAEFQSTPQTIYPTDLAQLVSKQVAWMQRQRNPG